MSYLCLKRDIPEGEYKIFESFGDSVIVKKEKDVLTVAKNACRHRGMKVADCDGKGSIKCQYHGQRFNYEHVLKHHEMGEIVFLPRFLSASSTLAEISSNIGEEFGSYQQTVKAPFHLWMQNTADPNHLATAHKDSFSKLFEKLPPEDVYISEFESGYNLRIKEDIVERYRKHYESCNDMFSHILGFPNLSVTSFLDVFYSVEHTNQVPEGCEVTTRFFMRKGLKKSLVSRLALDSNKAILAEDKELVEKWSNGYKYSDDIKWLPGEDRIRAYARECHARGYC